MSQKKDSITRVGFFAFLGVMIFTIGVFVLGDKSQFFTRTFYVYSTFKNVDGVSVGTPVRILGITVGSVADVDVNRNAGGQDVLVKLKISERQHSLIRESSVSRVTQEGLVGAKIITIIPGSPEAPLIEENGRLPSAEPFDYATVADNANSALKSFSRVAGTTDTLLQNIREGKGFIGKLFTDEILYTSLINTNAALAQKIGKLDGVIVKMDSLTSSAKTLVSNMNSPQGTLGALIHDRSLYDSVGQVMNSLAGTSRHISALAGAFEKTNENLSFAAYETGLATRGLRRSWLVGSLFKGGEEEDKAIERIKLDLIKRKELLDARERALDVKSQDSVSGK